jgi:gas vesicle protein
MSKYNLIDIFENYKIGSGWTTDFDYDGMLKAGLKAGVDTDIKVLKKMSDDFEDVNYHRENSHLQNAIDALEQGEPIDEVSMLFGDFHAEIKQTIKDQGMDIEPTLGKFMDARMEESKAVDLAIEASQEKAGIKEDLEQAKKDAIEDVKGFADRHTAIIKPYMDALMKYDIGSEEVKKAKLATQKGLEDLGKERNEKMGIKEESFVLDPIKSEMKMHLKAYSDGTIDGDDLYQAFDEIINGGIKPPSERGFNTKYGMEEVMGIDRKGNKQQDTDGSDATKFKKAAMSEKTDMDVPEKPSIIRALKVDGNGTKMEIDLYMASLKQSGDEFDDVDDYVEDFKNYVADKSLQEHFKRFM